MLRGYLLILSGYIAWGLFPLYWSLLAHVPPMEVLLHRIVWSVPVLVVFVLLRGRWATEYRAAIRSPADLRILFITCILITINWGVYIWAVANHRVVEASMGYFLTPLLHILTGVLIFKERLNTLKWLAVVCAALGVGYYIAQVDQFPWVALSVGFSFAGYGALRKKTVVGAVPGLLVETLMIAPFALAWVIWLHQTGTNFFLKEPPLINMWLVLGGLVTVAPLALFTAGARLLPMTTVGILFYITPTMQFLTGTFLMHEPMNTDKFIGFIGIWLGLALYTISLLRSRQRS